MKNHYDKIFLVLAFLVMSLSLAFFFFGNSSFETFQKKAKALKGADARGEDWEVQAVKKPRKSLMRDWQYPATQDDKGDWLFQVFTPPIIWEDAEGNLVTTAPRIEIDIKEEEKEALCELSLIALTSAEYPIRLIGSMGATNPIFDFRDTSKDIVFSGKKGQSLTYKDPKDITGRTMIDLGLKILDFKKERVKRADNTMMDLMVVEIEDSALGRTIELKTNEVTLLPEERKMKLVSDNGLEYFVVEKGDVIEHNASKYTVLDISFDDEFVELEQVPDDKKLLPIRVKLVLPKETLIKAPEENSEESYEEEYFDEDDSSRVGNDEGYSLKGDADDGFGNLVNPL